eukprot:TRINITY_DN21313_c0_g1_i1.p1 TRINITY_DN21313_c0_g1~~TRINITY_DN21313_c0_g1_i1.p1  ORF type:complete len:589 (+),score=142.75 TRINITY_DN21313_c0_g1_i1:48-1769(+)
MGQPRLAPLSLLSLLLLWTCPTHAATPHDTDDIALVGVGIYFNNVGHVDMQAGTFYADFNVYLRKSPVVYSNTLQAEGALEASGQCSLGTGVTGRFCACPPGSDSWGPYIYSEDEAVQALNPVNSDRLKAIRPVMNAGEGGGGPFVDFTRFQANHHFSPDVKDWPLDVQSLLVMFEMYNASTLSSTQVQFCHMESYSGVASNARFIPGMELSAAGDSPWVSEVSVNCWPNMRTPSRYTEGQCQAEEASENTREEMTCTCQKGGRRASRYAFALQFVRPSLPSFLKTFCPPIFITTVNQGVWFLYPKVYETRLGVCGSSLVSAVMYHASLLSSTPEHTTLTWADRFMMVVYFNNVVCFLMVFLQTVLFQAEYTGLSWKAFRFTRIWGPLTSLITFIGGAVFHSVNAVMGWAFGSGVVVFLLCYFCFIPVIDKVSPWWLGNVAKANVEANLKKKEGEEKIVQEVDKQVGAIVGAENVEPDPRFADTSMALVREATVASLHSAKSSFCRARSAASPQPSMPEDTRRDIDESFGMMVDTAADPSLPRCSTIPSEGIRPDTEPSAEPTAEPTAVEPAV